MNYTLLSVMYNINSCEVYCFSNSFITVYEESVLPGTKSERNILLHVHGSEVAY